MNVLDIVLSDLRSVLDELTRGDGVMSASVYDTAQVLRLAPISRDVVPAQEWLLSQQRDDGGWGFETAPRARDAPTLAAILALHSRREPRVQESVRAALDFLARQAPHWQDLPDDIPVAAELTILRLLEDAREADIAVPSDHYSALTRVGEQRRRRVRMTQHEARTPAAHCWETWGTDPDPRLLDVRGGVGVSPAATAAWLRAAGDRADLLPYRRIAEGYLERAQAATELGIPGCVPTSWPMERMEQQWALYAVATAGLSNHPSIASSVERQVLDLESALSSKGLGFSSFFMPDADCTGVTLAILQMAGRRPDPSVLRSFEKEDHFITYPGERNFSYSATAHAVHALALMGEDTLRWRQFFAKQQRPDGWWPQDKWHMSKMYATTQILFATHGQVGESFRAALEAILDAQKPEGGWGTFDRASRIETGHVVIALDAFRRAGIATEPIRAALRRAYRWLREEYRPFTGDYVRREQMWIGKELYFARRMDRPAEICALALLALADAEGRL